MCGSTSLAICRVFFFFFLSFFFSTFLLLPWCESSCNPMPVIYSATEASEHLVIIRLLCGNNRVSNLYIEQPHPIHATLNDPIEFELSATNGQIASSHISRIISKIRLNRCHRKPSTQYFYIAIPSAITAFGLLFEIFFFFFGATVPSSLLITGCNCIHRNRDEYSTENRHFFIRCIKFHWICVPPVYRLVKLCSITQQWLKLQN